jgi:CheY-like chemotaxis protein
MQAGSEAGAEMGSVAKGAVKGVVLGMGTVGKISAGVVTDAVRAAVWATGEVGGDVTNVTRKAIEGAIEAGKQLGMTAEEAAAAAGVGALEAAAGLGDIALKAADKALSGTISGVRLALGTAGTGKRVLIVDTNHANAELLAQRLVREGYQTMVAASLEELDQVIGEGGEIDIALVDLSGFDQAIWEKCEALRAARIPFIVISPQRSPAVQREGVRHGASGVLAKPLGMSELTEHIRMVLGE